jgi:hypothetical protein
LKKRRTGFRRRSPDCSCGFATASRKKYSLVCMMVKKAQRRMRNNMSNLIEILSRKKYSGICLKIENCKTK